MALFSNSPFKLSNFKLINQKKFRYLWNSSSSLKHFSSKNIKSNEFNEDEPLQYSKSDAAKWSAKDSRIGVRMEMPWFQPYVISLSVGIFLIYFCILREENDVDLKLNRNLYEHIEGLEEKQIILRIEYNIEHNLSTKELEERLAEIQSKKNKS